MVCKSSCYLMSNERSPMGINRDIGLPTRIEDDPQTISFYNTDTFAFFNGLDVPVYSNIGDIPYLPDRSVFLLSFEGVPRGMNPEDLYAMAIHVQPSYPSYPIPSVIIWVCVAIGITVAAIAFIVYTVYSLKKVIPCGDVPQIYELDSKKLIIMPNCDYNIYDTSTSEFVYDQWQKGVREESLYDKIIGILLIGGVAVGAIVILSKVLERKK